MPVGFIITVCEGEQKRTHLEHHQAQAVNAGIIVMVNHQNFRHSNVHTLCRKVTIFAVEHDEFHEAFLINVHSNVQKCTKMTFLVITKL